MNEDDSLWTTYISGRCRINNRSENTEVKSCRKNGIRSGLQLWNKREYEE